MKVRAMIAVEYEINDENLVEAYGTSDHREVLAQEKALLNGEEGQGDYLHMTLDGADRVTVISVTEVETAPFQIGDLIETTDSGNRYRVVCSYNDGMADLRDIALDKVWYAVRMDQGDWRKVEETDE